MLHPHYRDKGNRNVVKYCIPCIGNKDVEGRATTRFLSESESTHGCLFSFSLIIILRFMPVAAFHVGLEYSHNVVGFDLFVCWFVALRSPSTAEVILARSVDETHCSIGKPSGGSLPVFSVHSFCSN